jgi:hypothetical protein
MGIYYDPGRPIVSNAEIRTRCLQPLASTYLLLRRLRWFGHLCRMEDTRFALQAYRWKPPSELGQRPRGGVKKRWSAVIRSDVQELYSINMKAETRIRHREIAIAMADLEGRTVDRNAWRKWTYEKVTELRNRQQRAFKQETDR